MPARISVLEIITQEAILDFTSEVRLEVVINSQITFGYMVSWVEEYFPERKLG